MHTTNTNTHSTVLAAQMHRERSTTKTGTPLSTHTSIYLHTPPHTHSHPVFLRTSQPPPSPSSALCLGHVGGHARKSTRWSGKGDVWSLGLSLWAVAEGKRPFTHIDDDEALLAHAGNTTTPSDRP